MAVGAKLTLSYYESVAVSVERKIESVHFTAVVAPDMSLSPLMA
jgi:hypothetical protein